MHTTVSDSVESCSPQSLPPRLATHCELGVWLLGVREYSFQFEYTLSTKPLQTISIYLSGAQVGSKHANKYMLKISWHTPFKSFLYENFIYFKLFFSEKRSDKCFQIMSSPKKCPIKNGFPNLNGAKLFHLPGARWRVHQDALPLPTVQHKAVRPVHRGHRHSHLAARTWTIVVGMIAKTGLRNKKNRV